MSLYSPTLFGTGTEGNVVDKKQKGEKLEETIESCEKGILPFMKTPIYLKSVELYCAFFNCQPGAGDWRDQAVRASSSVGANLCEGNGRGSNGQKIFFYKIARGSAYECCHWANLADEDRDNLIQLSKEMSHMIDMDLAFVCRREQGIW